MRILIVTPFRQNIGGVEIVTQDLVRALQTKHQVDYLTTDDFSGSVTDKAAIKIFGLPFITSQKYKKLKIKYDVVIANGEFSWGINHPRLISYFHGSYYALKENVKKGISLKAQMALSWRGFLQHLRSRNKRIVSVSDFLAAILERHGARQIKVISNPVDTNLFTPQKKEKKYDFIFVARYDYYAKGFDRLAKLLKTNQSVLIVSDSTEYKPLVGTYLHKPARERLPELYNQSRILFFPSRFESFGQVPAEAMSCGLPVLMDKTGLAIELVREIPEFIVDFENMDDVTERAKLINSRYDEFSEKARAYALKHFSHSVFQESWLRYIEELQ